MYVFLTISMQNSKLYCMFKLFHFYEQKNHITQLHWAVKNQGKRDVAQKSF